MWVLLATALACGVLPRLDRRVAAAVLFLALVLAVYQHVLSGSGILALMLFALIMAVKKTYQRHRLFAIAEKSCW